VHLFHPALVHFSVSLLVLGGLIEGGGLLARGEPARRFGERLMLLGVASLLPTIFTGYLAANSLAVGAAQPVLDGHERNAWLLLGVCIAALFWKGWFRGRLPEGQRIAYAVLLFAIVVLTVWSAVLGGEMVYAYGVGTATGLGAP